MHIPRSCPLSDTRLPGHGSHARRVNKKKHRSCGLDRIWVQVLEPSHEQRSHKAQEVECASSWQFGNGTIVRANTSSVPSMQTLFSAFETYLGLFLQTSLFIVQLFLSSICVNLVFFSGVRSQGSAPGSQFFTHQSGLSLRPVWLTAH